MDTDPSSFDSTLSTTQTLSQAMTDLESRSKSFGSALTHALTSATTSGKSLQGVLASLGSRLTDIALSSALKPLESSLSGLAGNLLGSTASVTAFADGGVVRSPSLFPMGGNVGLMGEAGAEAILPLSRGPDGALGVASSGGAGATQIIFNVTAQDASSFRKTESQITTMLARSVARGRRGL